MAAPFSIGIASETKAYQQGIESGVIEPTEDAEKALKAFAKAGDKAGDAIEDAMRAAQRESDRARDEIEDMADSIEHAARESRGLGDGMKKGTREAGDAVETFGDEARQNLSETVSSFRGDLEDIPQLAQDILGGVAGDLGPVGMAIGAAGAAGIGLIVAAFQDAQEKEAEFRERVRGLADTLIDTGGEGAEGIAAIAEQLRELVVPEDGVKSLAEITAEAKRVGISVTDLAAAYGGASGNLQEYIDLMDEEYDKHTGLGQVATRENAQKLAAFKKTKAGLEELIAEQEAAAEAEKAWHESGAAALAARAEQMETLQGELDEAIGSWTEYTDAETGATDPAKYIEAMRARLDATASFEDNVSKLSQTFGLSFEEQQALLDQGVDFAPMLSAIMAGGSDMQAEYVAQLRAMLDGGEAIVNDTELTAQVTTQADTGDAEQQLDQLSTERDAPVTAEPDTKKAEQQLDQLAKKKRTARIVASLDTSSAEAAMTRFINRQRTATITAEVRDREGRLVP